MIKTFCYLFPVLLSVGCDAKQSEQDSSDKAIFSKEEIIATEDSTVSKSDSIGIMERNLLDAGLIDVRSLLPDIFVELKYSTEDNFFGRDVYGELTKCYLQEEVVQKLQTALEYLQKERPDLTFLIYDGVRPLSVQQILWDSLDKPDSLKPLYVADPKRGSLHNYGVAVDLTIAEKGTGRALDLGTHYDYFGYLAYPDREDQMLKEGKITHKQIQNRQLLREAMYSAGFMGIGSEWWHFNAYSLKEAKDKFEIIQ
ncbi:M15 family metallopeptidase [Echinicola sediminis]